MAKRMPFWGVGPVIGVTTAGYGLAAVAATLIWPSAFTVAVLPYPYLAVAGGTLLAIGVCWYAIAVRAVVKAYRQQRLVTDGIYALCPDLEGRAEECRRKLADARGERQDGQV